MDLRLVDTHCHLDDAYFPSGSTEAMARAREAGVVGFVAIGVGDTLKPAEAAVSLAKNLGGAVCAAVGVHPHDATTLGEAYEGLARLAAAAEVVAIGEMGLDFHYDNSPRDVQREAFARQIALARELRKPIVVHTREAASETLALLRCENARDVGGVIHCFSEDMAFAREALDLGFFLSFSGIVTFKKSESIQEVARWAPLESILVETDSPYLAPVPFRGKPCEPAYVVHTARRVAELRSATLEEVAVATTINASRLFGRPFHEMR